MSSVGEVNRKRKRQALRAAGLCIVCGAPGEGTGMYCPLHAEASRARARRRATDPVHREQLAARIRDRRSRWDASGRCLDCGALVTSGRRCERHVDARRAAKRAARARQRTGRREQRAAERATQEAERAQLASAREALAQARQRELEAKRVARARLREAREVRDAQREALALQRAAARAARKAAKPTPPARVKAPPASDVAARLKADLKARLGLKRLPRRAPAEPREDEPAGYDPTIHIDPLELGLMFRGDR